MKHCKQHADWLWSDLRYRFHVQVVLSLFLVGVCKNVRNWQYFLVKVTEIQSFHDNKSVDILQGKKTS